MRFEIDILDIKDLNDSLWILSKGNLYEYLKNLKPSFFEYIIQRKIVKNKYLNSLVNTILAGEPVPVITLTTEKKLQFIKDKNGEIDMNEVEILDGLQRTFRLWVYYKIIIEHKSNDSLQPIDFAKHIKFTYPIFFDSGVMTLTKIKDFFTNNAFDKIENAFKVFEIYFFIWSGLSPNKAIHKMLVLNAGQRPVSVSHQYELLFLYVWDEVKGASGIKLFRDRDPIANKIKQGDRIVGQYMFTSVIAGLRSFLENKPKKISIEDLEIDDLQQGENALEINEGVFTKPYIQVFLDKLIQIDRKIFDKEGDNGLKWFSRDISISGLFAGVGKYAQVKISMPISEIQMLTIRACDDLIFGIENYGLTLTEFQNEYYGLQTRTINLGNYARNIIMEYIYDLLNGNRPSWSGLFSVSKVEN